MRPSRMFRRALVRCSCLMGVWGVLSAPGADASEVHVVTVEGVINPVSAHIIERSIGLAAEAGAEALIIELDTPGGLLKSVHEISKNILSAGVPVVVYVSPPGSRATSAGVLVTISAHVAAMAPGTHIGAAHVVTMQGAISDSVVNNKAMNDWVAELRSVADQRGRNSDWVERAARESASITADDALVENVIDFLAENVEEVVAQLDGRTVDVKGTERQLSTAESTLVRHEPSLADQILGVFADPSVAYLLLMLGFYGLYFELANPGAIFPGVVGAIAIVIGLYSLHTLPLNYAGVLLMLLAIGLFIADTQIPSGGLLTVGGMVALVFGSLMLLDKAGPMFQISLGVIVPVALVTGAFFTFAVSKALRAQRGRTTTGQEGLVGEEGVVRAPLDPRGKVFLHGELWEAESAVTVPEGAEVRVIRVAGMRLFVEPVRVSDPDRSSST